MSTVSSPGLKQRGAKKRPTTPNADGQQNGDVDFLDKAQKTAKQTLISEWDYKLAITVCTVLAFVTRFYGISHPDQVVFDEVHFGKVGIPC